MRQWSALREDVLKK